MWTNMSPERYFFMYAFPCAHLKLERGDINEEEYKNLEKMFLNNDSPTREVLERIFSPAFFWIKQIAKRENKDIWDFDVIKKYWETEHNEIIDKGKGVYAKFPKSLKDLCKIQNAEVIDKHGNFLKVKYNQSERGVFDSILSNIKIGDKVRIHYAYAVERV